MPDRDKDGPTKKVTAGVELVSSTDFECAKCGYKTKKLQEMLDHEREVLHELAFGNYPCGRCKKQVTIVADYIDKPAPDSGLPADNTKKVHEMFTMVKSKPSTASARGNAVYCEDCKKIILKEIST